jgi:hypothetical protein
MGFRLAVAGSEQINLDERQILRQEYRTETPRDSDARSTDVYCTLTIEGKIIPSINAEESESAINLGKWSKIPAERADSYRSLSLETIAAGQVVRKLTLPQAFVVDYHEKFGDTTGVGTFTLIVRQKKDKTANVKIEGGFSAE